MIRNLTLVHIFLTQGVNIVANIGLGGIQKEKINACTEIDCTESFLYLTTF